MQTGKGTFRMLADKTAEKVGSPGAFFGSIGVVVLWALSGFVLGFTNAWQLVINTVTNIVTLFIVFLIQNTQNRDSKAVHLKLDELIRAVREARTQLVGLENLSDEELEALGKQFGRIRQREIRKLGSDKPAGAD